MVIVVMAVDIAIGTAVVIMAAAGEDLIQTIILTEAILTTHTIIITLTHTIVLRIIIILITMTLIPHTHITITIINSCRGCNAI